ncbi:MAG: acetylornithine transaminase [Deltaproteobacteria bacterium]|nr:acetylornithine transaminase [Deltaproteobacteria bacterium]
MSENKVEKETTQSLADRVMFQTYGRFPITLVKGEGCRVWDEQGKEYLDFVGGIAVCALGHASPVVTEALETQAKELVHVSNLYYTRPQTELAALLVENAFADRVFFCNSGAEANEAAIKLARRYTGEKNGPGRHTLICMENSFHGRTMATLSATGQRKIQAGYDPLLEGFRFVPFSDLQALENAMDGSVCAVMLEPIQGEGGVIVPDPDYLKGVRDLCDNRDALLIFDEVQVGMGRTGKLFAYQHYGVTPDIMTLAKALGNGLPIGAMLATETVSTAFGPGSHASTFGGTPLVTAVSRAVLKSLMDDGWIENAAKMGAYLKKELEVLAQKHDAIKEVRGLGLIVGLALETQSAPVVRACLERGVLINAPKENVLRFIPPLIINEKDVDRLIEVLDGVFAS